MNTDVSGKQSFFRSRIVARLWVSMMLLVVLGVAFMLVVQIVLFEQNYINAAVADVNDRLEPFVEELKKDDLSVNEQLILSLSKVTNGKMMVVDSDGHIVALYSAGHKLDSQSNISATWFVKYSLKWTKGYQGLAQGNSYTKIIRKTTAPITLEIGIPARYDNRQAAVVLYQTLDQLQTVLRMNRNQLVMLSISLTLAAAIAAALLSRHFVKPIRIIQHAVDSLAQGELTATPGLTLRDELGQLSDSVDALAQALQRVDILRKEVIANVSHELRSPLALIRGYAEMVRDINWTDDEKRNEDLGLIIQEADRMSEMVSDILDYSQLQAGYIHLKKGWYNLYEVVESEITRCEQSAAEYGIAICLNSLKTEIFVCIDALKICQVMRNLLNNAINHTDNGNAISVTIEESAGEVRVSVMNPGEPIPDDDREVIWERYQRSQHHGGRKQGTGIGLSIVSTFLKAHNMRYGVECREGLTTFWFECSEMVTDH